MKHVLFQRAALTLALVAALAACDKDDSTPAADTGAKPATPAAVASAPVDDGRNDAVAQPAANEAPLVVSDLEAYARGMRQEVALLKAAGDKVAQARAKNDKDAEASAMMDMATLDTDTEGARASGLSPARYLFVKSTLDSSLGKAEMLVAMNPGAGDAASGDGRGDARAAIGNPYDGLADDVASALKARQAELAQLRAQAIAARFSAAR